MQHSNTALCVFFLITFYRFIGLLFWVTKWKDVSLQIRANKAVHNGVPKCFSFYRSHSSFARG